MEKKIMLGNQAIARGAYEAGVKVSSAYPGTPSTEVSEYLVKYEGVYAEWAPNEKVATEVAVGASMSGVRAMCAMKHVGVNVAADPLYSVSYVGANGGLVMIAADDPGLYSSQNEQDTRRVARAACVPVIEPSDSEEARYFTKRAFEISEEYDTPVIVRTTTRLAHSQGLVNLEDRVEPEDKPYERNPAKFVMMPGNAKGRHLVVEARTNRLIEDACTIDINKVTYNDTKIGVITSGIPYQYVKEVLPNASILKLGLVNPLPKKLIEEFASKVETLYIVEELEPVIEEQVKSWGIKCIGKEIFTIQGEYSANLLREAILGEKVEADAAAAVPMRPPILCPGCPHRSVYTVLNKLKIHAAGDIGCYTLGAVAPLSAMDMTLCMGASVSAVHGFNKAMGADGEGKSVGIIGDSTFMHSGMTGLANIAYNQSNSTVIILDNSITGMTGHQQNPTTGYNIKGDPAGKIDLEALCRAMGIDRVVVTDPYDLKEFDRVLKEELAAEEPSVIIARRPCALLKYVKHNTPLTVNTDKCTGCGACMRIGCPAISMKEGKACVDKTLCVGCDVCMQMCHFDSFERIEKEGE